MTNQTPPSTRTTITRLHQLENGRSALVVSVDMKPVEYQLELTSLGISPHAIIRMSVNHRSHIIFNVGGKIIAVDREIAAAILVRPI